MLPQQQKPTQWDNSDHSGTVLKKERAQKDWEWCWLVLKNKMLYYFHDEMSSSPFEIMDLNHYGISENPKKQREYAFALYQITADRPTDRFCIIDGGEYAQWIKFLKVATNFVTVHTPQKNNTKKPQRPKQKLPKAPHLSMSTMKAPPALRTKTAPLRLHTDKDVPDATIPWQHRPVSPRKTNFEMAHFKKRTNPRLPLSEQQRPVFQQNRQSKSERLLEKEKIPLPLENTRPRHDSGAFVSAQPRASKNGDMRKDFGRSLTARQPLVVLQQQQSLLPTVAVSPTLKKDDKYLSKKSQTVSNLRSPKKEARSSSSSEEENQKPFHLESGVPCADEALTYPSEVNDSTKDPQEKEGPDEIDDEFILDLQKDKELQKLNPNRSRSLSIINGILDEIVDKKNKAKSMNWRPGGHVVPQTQTGNNPISLTGTHRNRPQGDVEETDDETAKLQRLRKTYIMPGDPRKKYSISNQSIGKGSVGEVFFATCGDTKVAVKRLELIRRGRDRLPLILREIEIIATSQHPNIVRYIETFDMGHEIWVVMEYMSCGSLYDVVKLHSEGIRLGEDQTSYTIHQVLLALAFLHSRNRIHRDIKVDNILLSTDGSVKLADFGTAVQLTFQRLRRNTMAGTPYYMAPELIQRLPYKEKVDIWSVGITVLELITGSPPYYHLEPHEALEAIAHHGVRGLSSKLFSESIVNFTNACCLAQNPDLRSSASQLLSHPFIQMSCSKEQFAAFLQNMRAAQGARFDDNENQGCTIL